MMVVHESDYLEHYGIVGMKWGVRRYQNRDGSLTAAGKRRAYGAKTYKKVDKTKDDVQAIVDTMSNKERRLLGINKGKTYMNDDEIQYVAKRFIEKYGDKPVAFLDIYYKGNGAGEIAIGTRSGEEYRGKGYASSLVTRAKKWLETPEAKDILQINMLEWNARISNTPSISIAKKHGFEGREGMIDDEKRWLGRYKRR